MLALDDFGAGYSSLSRLRTLPVDVIKIDRAFMQDLPIDPRAVAVVDAIVALAHACRCDVVTEGVETEAQLTFLAERGCRLGALKRAGGNAPLLPIAARSYGRPQWLTVVSPSGARVRQFRQRDWEA